MLSFYGRIGNKAKLKLYKGAEALLSIYAGSTIGLTGNSAFHPEAFLIRIGPARRALAILVVVAGSYLFVRAILTHDSCMATRIELGGFLNRSGFC